jgi:hypothetical protein
MGEIDHRAALSKIHWCLSGGQFWKESTFAGPVRRGRVSRNRLQLLVQVGHIWQPITFHY